MTERLNEDIRRFIDGELEPMEVRRVLHAAADDAAARDLLRMEFKVRRVFEENREAAWAVPEGFSDRVMAQIVPRRAEAESRSADGSPLAALFNRAVDVLLTARPVMFRPAYALGFMLALTVVALLVLDGPRPQSTDMVAGTEGAHTTEQAAGGSNNNLLVPFMYVSDDASSVAVAGDFNGWEPTSLQRKELDGQVVWTAIIPVSRGEHRYMFVIDGSTWKSDPLATVHRDDGFGNTNAVLAL